MYCDDCQTGMRTSLYRRPNHDAGLWSRCLICKVVKYVGTIKNFFKEPKACG
jgi:hypothetical protein